MRIDWDGYFINIAETVAGRATCTRLKVGCVITRDKQIIATGYNGSIHGHPHCTEVGCLTNSEGRCIRTIHAEQNAIIHARTDLTNSIAYITHEPCDTCTKLLIQAGVAEVIYLHAYENRNNQLFNTGIHWEQYIKQKEN
jgi:dCMP deaminase